MTTQAPASVEIEKLLRVRTGLSKNFDYGSERKTQNPAGVDSGILDPWLSLIQMKTE